MDLSSLNLKYGSTFSITRLPKELKEFHRYLENNTTLRPRTKKNYTNGIAQLIDITQKELDVDFQFGKTSSLDYIKRLTELESFSKKYSVGKKIAGNYKELNTLFSGNYNASIDYYTRYTEFINNTHVNDMKVFYALRTKDEKTIESIKSDKDVVTISELYNFIDEIKVGDLIAIVYGGEKSKVSWETGLAAIGAVASEPKDIGYSKTSNGTNKYRIEITKLFLIESPLSKRALSIYPEIIGTPYLAYRDTQDVTQAISKIHSLENRLALIRALVELVPESKNILTRELSREIIEKAVQESPKYILENSIVSINNNRDNNIESFINTYEQIIYYGAPGTGKSHLINESFSDFKRITFHPEYSYFDFIGGLRPVYTDSLKYEFIPGPFLDAYIYALKNPGKKCGLIIEELNRSNTARVFGDIFQLLDRGEDGWSKYPITNKDINDYLVNSHEMENINIKLPPNFSIIASMNSADQGVFVLDSAFKRRWEFEYIPIEPEKATHSNEIVEGFNLTWIKVISSINERLSEIGVEEDKLIGEYFLNPKEIKDIKKVASKLLLYLWDDVVRYQRETIFSESKRFSHINSIFCGETKNLLCFSKDLQTKLQQ